MTEERPDKGNTIEPVAAVVPASVRADGSVRKERRIRPGYIPQELKPKYTPPSQRRSAPTPTSNDSDKPLLKQQEQEPKSTPLPLPQEKAPKHTPPSPRNPPVAVAGDTKQPVTPRTNGAKGTKEVVGKKYIPPHARKAAASKKDDEGDMLADSLARMTLKAKDKGKETQR
ncbi:hypothetical protein IWW57_006695 [Coemansia sp. S610]|nr:hypothetical protein IWW57_006695 [Coemansia sp. S610]KAJ2412250.1 hypothetical protein GGI10_003796 [Coemansia sp. RSA 2530]KAJ2696702.1 hypothetical protein H4218_004433 [Coemansia sp. IMI 209128]